MLNNINNVTIQPKPSEVNIPLDPIPSTTSNNADTILEIPPGTGDGVDGRAKSFWTRIIPRSDDSNKRQSETFASKKTAAEGMMDIALLTANANQLRFLFTYNTESKTYLMSVSLIIASLILQVAVGVTLIFKVGPTTEERHHS